MMRMLKENGQYSFTRCIALVGFATFIIVSLYLAYKGTTWGNYDTFASLAGGGGAVTQIANKLINSRYNTPEGEGGKP